MWLLYSILLFVLFCIIFLSCSFLWQYLEHRFNGEIIQKSDSYYKKESFFKKIFIDFPKQFMNDLFSRDSREFPEYGLHLFCGEQGSGKTTAAIKFIMDLQSKFPACKVSTNCAYLYEDSEIFSYRDILKTDNGILGHINFIDEIQTWFNSLDSKNFPPEMLSEISQQRKQRKLLVGTAQIFGRVAKPIREQVTFVYLPMTIFNCITIVRVSKPIYYDETNFRFKKYLKTYFFVHNEKIRNSFDTFKKIERYSRKGFIERNSQLNNNNDKEV